MDATPIWDAPTFRLLTQLQTEAENPPSPWTPPPNLVDLSDIELMDALYQCALLRAHFSSLATRLAVAIKHAKEDVEVQESHSLPSDEPKRMTAKERSAAARNIPAVAQSRGLLRALEQLNALVESSAHSYFCVYEAMSRVVELRKRRILPADLLSPTERAPKETAPPIPFLPPRRGGTR